MLLTLEVISPNGEALGANRRKTVGPEGGIDYATLCERILALATDR